MNTGASRELFELWAPDSRNGLIVTGYSVEGTLARVSDNWLAFATCGHLSLYVRCTYPEQWEFVCLIMSLILRSLVLFWQKRSCCS